MADMLMCSGSENPLKVSVWDWRWYDLACLESRRGQRDGGKEESQLLGLPEKPDLVFSFSDFRRLWSDDGAWLRETPSAAWIYVPRRRWDKRRKIRRRVDRVWFLSAGKHTNNDSRRLKWSRGSYSSGGSWWWLYTLAPESLILWFESHFSESPMSYIDPRFT